MYRSVLMLISACAALVVLSLAASAAASPPNRCLVVNTRADVAQRTPREAVDAASTGDTLRVRGTCARTP
jgi:hypothetical protein